MNLEKGLHMQLYRHTHASISKLSCYFTFCYRIRMCIRSSLVQPDKCWFVIAHMVMCGQQFVLWGFVTHYPFDYTWSFV